MSAGQYDKPFSDDSVYSSVLALLTKRQKQSGSPAPDSIHIDLAAGYGAIGPELEHRLGLRYVGVDVDAGSVSSMRSRSLEGHHVDLLDERLEAIIEEMIAGRPVGSISVMDGIEHVPDATELLRVIGKVAADSGATVVLSVPNVTHIDVGTKTLLGSWAYTTTGLLDETHLRFYSETGLLGELRAAGLKVVERNDYVLERSDQSFPLEHPALSPATNLRRFLQACRSRVEPNGTVNQFIWACEAAEPVAPTDTRGPEEESRPFLSVVLETTSDAAGLSDVLTCLAAQTLEDFEVLVLTPQSDRGEVDVRIAECPRRLRERTRRVDAPAGNRAARLNSGLDATLGLYVAVLGEGDLPFAHWVQAFAEGVMSDFGRVVRAHGVRQGTEDVSIHGLPAVRASSGFEPVDPLPFSFVAQLGRNLSPLPTVALPMGLFRSLNLRFDDSLSSIEDWDYVVRAASLAGVTDSSDLTVVLRGSGRAAAVDPRESDDETAAWQSALDAEVMLLPTGTLSELRRLADATGEPSGPQDPVDRSLLVRALDVTGSRSWRLTAPLRVVRPVRNRRPALSPADLARMPVDELRATLDGIERSRSWRLARTLAGLRERLPSVRR